MLIKILVKFLIKTCTSTLVNNLEILFLQVHLSTRKYLVKMNKLANSCF